jgi:hypothetical protein
MVPCLYSCAFSTPALDAILSDDSPVRCHLYNYLDLPEKGNESGKTKFNILVSYLLFVILKTSTFTAYMALNELRIYKTVTICSYSIY